jgi:transcriptional regulator with GAF, ATPase, and Fis domain
MSAPLVDAGMMKPMRLRKQSDCRRKPLWVKYSFADQHAPSWEFDDRHEAPPRFRAGLALFELELAAIRQGLSRTGGSASAAAKLLRMTTRSLANRMRRHGVERARQSLARTAKHPESVE